MNVRKILLLTAVSVWALVFMMLVETGCDLTQKPTPSSPTIHAAQATLDAIPSPTDMPMWATLTLSSGSYNWMLYVQTTSYHKAIQTSVEWQVNVPEETMVGPYINETGTPANDSDLLLVNNQGYRVGDFIVFQHHRYRIMIVSNTGLGPGVLTVQTIK